MKKDDKIKICHICSYYENILFDNLVTAQMEYTEPRVFFFKQYGREKQYDNYYIDEVNCFHERDRLLFHLKEKKAYDALIGTYSNLEAFDITFAHSLFVNGYLSYKLKKTYGIPYVVMVQNTDLNVFYKYRKYLNNVGLRVLSNADGIIFASDSYRDLLLKKYIPSKYRKAIAEKARVVPYGIDDVFFDEESFREKDLQEPAEVISVGLICRNKNQTRLCKAIELLRNEGLDIKLTIIGKNGSKKIMKEISRFDFVKILPYMAKNELKKQYKKSNIFALASLTETFGLVYAEALSQSLPIVYSQGQGFDGQFPEGLVGYSVDASSVKSIANGIKKTINNYENLLGRTVKASEKFRWKAITMQYINLYQEILRNEK